MKKKLIVILWAYFAWVAAALVFNKKDPESIKAEFIESKQNWKNTFKVFLNNFIEIHQNLLESFKEKVFTEKNKKIFNDKKEELIQKFNDYKSQAERLLNEYKEKWIEFSKEKREYLEQEINKSIEKIEEFKNELPEKIDEVKSFLQNKFDKIKSKLKK